MVMGRVIRHKQGFQIVEEKDANDEQKSIKEVNSGIYLVRTSYLKNFFQTVKANNKSGEFYLTDLFQAGQNVEAVKFPR
jgi:bifunctional UDP-N-acetylglucosamine pyrophosphorylase/glucosamine-1-phosphate N-acetyltransferase